MIDYDRDPYSFVRRLFDGAPVVDDLPDDDLAWMARAMSNDVSAGTTLFTASTNAVDRAGDVVDQSWELAEFRACPAILDNHDPMRMVGRALSVSTPKDTGNLEILVQWDMENPDDKVRSVGHQHLNGFRSAGSVGFRAGKTTARNKLPTDHYAYAEPTKIETPWGTYEMIGNFYQRNKLYEFSSASVPMNPQALHRQPRDAGKTADANRMIVKGIRRRAVDAAAADTAPADAVPTDVIEYLSDPDRLASVVDLLWPELLDRAVAALVPPEPPADPAAPADTAPVKAFRRWLHRQLRADPAVRRILLAHFESAPAPVRATPRPVALRGDGLDFLFPEP